MTREKRTKLIRHLRYNRSIGADYLITDEDADEIIKALEQEPCDDAVSRQAAIDALHMHLVYRMGTDSNKKRLDDWINNLPSAQPDGIPLEWIDKHLEWLDNCDNDFAQLAKVGIRAMVEIWKKDKT